MSFYDRALDLYYRIRYSGYSVPLDYQQQIIELKQLEQQQYNIPSLTQPAVRPIGERYLTYDIDTLKQPELPRIDSLESIVDRYIPRHINELEQARNKLSDNYIQTVKIQTFNQDPLPKIDTNQWIGANVIRFEQQHEFNTLEPLEQPKLTPIEDNTILKPLIRTKRKSWGGVYRIYNLNVQDITRLKRSILRRYKRPKLNHYETKGQDLNKLTARLRRGLSHVKYIADIKLSDATPTAIYNMNFVYYYKVLVWQAFKQDIYAEMSKPQRKAFKNAWYQGMVSKTAIINFMVDKLIEYGGGDIRTTDEKAITRIVLANDLAVRRVYGNLKEVIAVGWEEYHQQKWNELHVQTTTAGAMLEKDVVDDLREDLKALEKVENAK